VKPITFDDYLQAIAAADWTGRDFNEVQIVGSIGRQRAIALYLQPD
jgi:hypothetical protein